MSEVMKSSCREKDERDGMCQNNGGGEASGIQLCGEGEVREKTLAMIPNKNTIYRSHPQLCSTLSENY